MYNIFVPIFKKVNKDFFKKWSPEMAYVLGFFMADGYITHNRRGASFFCFQICDLGILKKIRTVLGSEHKISIKTKRRTHHSLQYRLQVGSKEMCADLERLGAVAGKTNNLSVPKVPSGFFPSFLRGYFDGDGNVWVGLVNKKRKVPRQVMQVAFTSCSTNFLADLLEHLTPLGISGGAVNNNKIRNFSRLSYGTKDSLRLYDFMYNRYALKGGLFLDRKRAVFESYKKLRA